MHTAAQVGRLSNLELGEGVVIILSLSIIRIWDGMLEQREVTWVLSTAMAGPSAGKSGTWRMLDGGCIEDCKNSCQRRAQKLELLDYLYLWISADIQDHSLGPHQPDSNIVPHCSN